jgi:hypothetical protein
MLKVLLGRVFELGLISESSYKAARDSLAARLNMPEMLCDPSCIPEEEIKDGDTQNTQ